ncbi:MAG: GGDEF domain-containing protein, partial [Negativicutes bacterium]|nr:GGDEF domain-containing protein [Negativicutes bacterium]
DEFVAVLREIACGDAEAAAVRIRQEIARHNAGSAQLPLSISLGVAEGVPLQEDINNLFKQADDAMYRDKLSHSPNSRSAIVNALLQSLEARNPDAKETAERLKAQLAALAKQPC